METQIILEKTKFCHLLLSVDLNPVWNTAKSNQKGPTFRLVFHHERLVSETFPIAISLHIFSQTVQVLKSPVALTVPGRKRPFQTANFADYAIFDQIY